MICVLLEVRALPIAEQGLLGSAFKTLLRSELTGTKSAYFIALHDNVRSHT